MTVLLGTVLEVEAEEIKEGTFRAILAGSNEPNRFQLNGTVDGQRFTTFSWYGRNDNGDLVGHWFSDHLPCDCDEDDDYDRDHAFHVVRRSVTARFQPSDSDLDVATFRVVIRSEPVVEKYEG